MKKITSIFMMLLMLCTATSLKAQSLEDFGMTPMLTDSTQLYSPCSDSAEGTNMSYLIDGDPSTFWHTDWHGVVTGSHWFRVELPEEMTGDLIMTMTRRAGAGNDHPTGFIVEGSTDGENWSTIDTLSFAYNGAGTTETTAPWTLKKSTKFIKFTVTGCAPTSTAPAGTMFFHAAEVQLYKAEGDGLAMYILNNTLSAYDGYLPGGGLTFDMGTEPGQYSNVEAWNQFQEDLLHIQAIMEGEADAVSYEEAMVINQRISENYQAVLASKVPLGNVATGYYYIAADLAFTNVVTDTVYNPETGEPEIDPETGEIMVNSTNVHPTKALYATETNLNWNTLDENSAPFLFHIEKNEETGNYIFKNAGFDTYVDTVITSTGVTMSKTKEGEAREVAFELQKKDSIHGYVISICRAIQKDQSNIHLHIGGHNSGAGVSGNIVGWGPTAGASLWYLIPVETELAEKLIEEFAPVRDRNIMLKEVKKMVKEGSEALVIAEDIITEIYTDQPLISVGTQFSSPFTITDGQVGTIEEVYPLLLDNQMATFWHSTWEGGSVPAGTHYLQVELTEPKAVTEAAVKFTRRGAAANDHITVWGVYGTNDAEADQAKDSCEFLATLTTPLGSVSETLTTAGFPTKGYKYIRFYIMDTAGTGITATRGYGHVSEFQMFPAKVSANAKSQLVALGELGTNLQAAIDACPEADSLITVEYYNELKEAYDAFMAKYVDPTPLRTAIANAQAAFTRLAFVEDLGIEATTPGYWTKDDTAEFEATFKQVTDYDVNGVYDAAKSEEMIELLATSTDELFGKANKVSTDKWYFIKYAPESLYDEFGWGKSGATDTTALGNLFDQCITAATYTAAADGNPAAINAVYGEEVVEGLSLRFTEKSEEDGFFFRFVNVGDTAYVIQNKATGLFISCTARNNNNVTLGLNPTIFKISAIGKGELLFHGNKLDGTDVANLHAQRSDHRLVTWETSTMGSNSGLMVEEADVTDEEIAAITRNVEPGKIYPQCYPVGITADEGMYTVEGTFTENDKNYVALNSITEAAPGMPFILLQGTTEDYIAPVEGEEVATEQMYIKSTTEVVATPDSINGFYGTFDYKWVEKGTTVFVNNGAEGATGEENTNCTRDVNANTGYIMFGTKTVEATGTYDLVIEITGKVWVVAIEEALANVNKAGNIYDLNGRLVRANGTINDINRMSRGTYILNGVKVMVK